MGMTTTFRRQPHAIAALAAAGVLWGLTVPLSKVGLGWLDPTWLGVARFALAAPLLAILARGALREAMTPGIAAAGALGYGAVILLQNAGLGQTSVSHAALIVGATPVLVTLFIAAGGGARGAAAWIGPLIGVAGVGMVAGGGGTGSTPAGDLLVLVSVVGSAAFMVVQPRLLAGRDPGAVTAVQLGAAALASLPVAVIADGAPPAPEGPGVVAAVLALALAGTLVAYWLFAWAQARVPAPLAGAFVNLEPLVGAIAGVAAFGDPVGPGQALGALAIVAAIGLTGHGEPAAADGPERATRRRPHRIRSPRGRDEALRPPPPARARARAHARGRGAVARVHAGEPPAAPSVDPDAAHPRGLPRVRRPR